MIELKDTVKMMESPDYKERFQAEFHQLNTRLHKLIDMVNKWDAGTLNFTPTCPRDIYDRQISAMSEYHNTLLVRAKLEGVDLGEEFT